MDDLSGAGIHLASAYVSVIADLRPLEAGLTEAEAQTKAFARTTTASTATASAALAKQGAAATAMGTSYVAAGKKIGGVGKTLNRTVTLPLVGIGVAAGVMSVKFNRSMTEISTQAGASRSEVKKLSKEVLDLAAGGRFAQGPQDLASALFDIESVGYRGAKAMKTLGAASDFAAVGNADLEQTTSALVGALKTGIKGAGSARQAIGYLNATIGAGKMHMEDLNGAIGTGFLGSAKGLGLSLQSVGSALAELTSQGVPANSAATRLRMSFSLLANPTEKAQKILAAIGIGSEDLAKKMRSPDGLGKALEELKDHLKGLTQVEQQQLIAGAFGGAKSGGTIVQLLGNLDDLNVKYEEIGDNAHDFNEKLKETNEDPAVKLDKAWSALQADLIQVGDVLGATVVPMLLAGGEALGGLAQSFDALPDGTKQTVAGLLLITAAAGPLLRIVGFMTKGWGLLLLGVDKLELSLMGGAAASTEAAAANSVLSASYVELGASIRTAAGAQGAFSATQSGLLIPGAAGAGKAAAGGRMSGILNKAGRGLLYGAGGYMAGQVAQQTIGGNVGKLAGNVGTYAGIGAGVGSIVPGVGTALGAGVGAGVGAIKTDIELLTGAEQHLHPVQEKLAASSASVKKWFDAQRKASHALSAAEDAVTHSKHREKGAADNVREAQQHLNAAIRNYGPDSQQAVKAEFELARAQGKHARAAHAVEAAERKKGFALKAYQAATRVTLGTEKMRIAALTKQAGSLERLLHKEEQAGASAKRLGDIGRKGTKTLNALSTEHKKYASTLGDAASKAGPKWAHHMDAMSGAELKFGHHLDSAIAKLNRLGDNAGPKKLGQAMKGVRTELQGFTDHMKGMAAATGDFDRKTTHLPTGAVGAWKKIRNAGGEATGHIATGVQKVTGAQDKFKSNADRNLGAVGKGYKGLDRIASHSLSDISQKADTVIGHFGGGVSATGTVSAKGQVGRHAQGGKVTKPIAVMGEEAPAHHEWVVATNPAYRNQNLGYWAQAGKDLGVPGFAEGGKHGGLAGGAGSLPHPHVSGPAPVAGASQAAIDAAFKAAQKGIEKARAAGGPAGGSFGPAGVGSYMGVPMANWVIQALMFAASKGVSASPTSGWRSPTEVVNSPVVAPQGKSEHQGTQYPHGAVDFGGPYDPAAKVTKMAVVGATAGFKYPLLAPIGFRDDGHASGTGHKKGGLLGVPAGRTPGYQGAGTQLLSSTGAGVPSWVHGSSTLNADQMATLAQYVGADDPGLMSQIGGAESKGNPRAMGSAGDKGLWQIIPGTAGAFGIDYGGLFDPLNNAKGMKKIADGQGLTAWSTYKSGAYKSEPKGTPSGNLSDIGTGKEEVPAVFHGARTKSLSFGAIPKTLHGVIKEIKRRQNELPRYRGAAKKADGRPAIARAIKANVTALENRLKQLFRAKAKLRRELAEKKYKKRLGRQLGGLTGYEKTIEGQQRDYEIANQTAGQIVGTEPLPPELPASATEAQRVDAEKKYVQELESYVTTREEPAYLDVLAKEAAWRNTILSGEGKAHKMELGWEQKIREAENEIDSINKYTAKVSKDVGDYRQEHPKAKTLPDWLVKEQKKEHELRAKLPLLRFKERELRTTLGTGRGIFYRGVKDPVHPPIVPLEGTGTFEQALNEVQGIHWPDQHSKMKTLPTKRAAGMFGGAIWDTQEVMEELGLKSKQAANAIGEPGSEGSSSDLEEIAKQIITETNQRGAIEAAQKPILDAFKTLPPFGGSFLTGGTVPGPLGAARLVEAHGGETITPPGGSGSPIMVQIIVEDGAVDTDKIRVVADQAVDVRLRRGGRQAGRALPGGAGGRFA